MTTRTSLIAIIALLIAGCGTTGVKKLDDVVDKLSLAKKESKGEKSEYASPTQLVAIWSDAVYTGPGCPPIRGFGGRLYFYDGKNEVLPVEGQLTVYAYDDSGEMQPARMPDRKFVFTQEQFTDHFTPSDLGASYSIWLPWDEVGGVRKSVSLLPVFTSSDGKVVMGQQTMNILRGRVPEDAEQTQEGHVTPLSPTGRQEIRPASHEQSVASTRDQWEQTHMYVPKDASRKRLRSTTIQVPMAMSKRLVQNTTAGTPSVEYERNERGVATRMPHVTDGNGQQEGADVSQQSADASATASPLPSRPLTRFVRPRYQAPRGLHGRPTYVHPRTPPGPELPQ